MEPRRKKKLLQQGVTIIRGRRFILMHLVCYGDFLLLQPPKRAWREKEKKEHPQLKIRTGGNNFFTLQEEPRDVQQRALLHISLRSASDFLLEGEKQTPKTQSTRVESLISYRTWGKKRESTRHKHSEPLKTKAGRLCQLNKSLFFLSPQVSKEIFHTNFDPFRQVYTEKLIYV